jgi:hypothetical protein
MKKQTTHSYARNPRDVLLAALTFGQGARCTASRASDLPQHRLEVPSPPRSLHFPGDRRSVMTAPQWQELDARVRLQVDCRVDLMYKSAALQEGNARRRSKRPTSARGGQNGCHRTMSDDVLIVSSVLSALARMKNSFDVT